MILSPFASALLRMCAPLLIWAAHFLVIYAFTAVACERNFAVTRMLGINVVSGVIGIATLVAAAATLMTIRAALGQRGRGGDDAAAFVHWLSAAAGGLALVAILWEALPVLLVPMCG